MVTRRRRAERGDGLGHAVLEQRDHVHVALDHDQAWNLRVRLTYLPEREQLLALVEQRGLGRVEVFRPGVFGLFEDPSAERDCASAPVGDREHHAVAEVFVLAALAAFDQAGLFEQGHALRRGAERGFQRVPLIWRVAEAKALDCRHVEPARVEIGACLVALRQLALIELRRRIEQRVQVGRILERARAAALVRDLEADALGQFFDSIGKLHAVVVHQKADRAAVRATAEAVVELLGRTDRERRRALVVERAARAPVAPGLAQWHALLDHLDDVDACEQFVDELGGDAAGHGCLEPISKRSERRQFARHRSAGTGAYTEVCEDSEHRRRAKCRAQ